MTFVHLHLMASHIPVVGILLLLPLLLFALLKRSDDLAKTGLWGLVLVGIAAASVYLTGEPTEEGVESLAGISKPMIEQHDAPARRDSVRLHGESRWKDSAFRNHKHHLGSENSRQ